MCYKFQRIISSYLNFNEILGRKNFDGVPIYLQNMKILTLQLHKCTFLTIFKVFVKCFRVPILMINSKQLVIDGWMNKKS